MNVRPANWPGKCQICNASYNPGDPITHLPALPPSKTPRSVHERCAKKDEE